MMRTINIDNRGYAVGLWWQTPTVSQVKQTAFSQANKKDMLELARSTAKAYKDDDYNYWTWTAEQYGLGHYAGEMPRKAVPLAASLQPEQENFLGVFCLDKSLWWVYARLHDHIMPDGDTCYSTKEEALTAASSLRQLIDPTGLKETICDTPEESLRYLKSLLVLTVRPLRPLFGPEPYERLVSRGLIGGAIF
jgi:hypothetical protein